MTIGEQINKYRKKRNLTIEQLAIKCGMSYSSMQDYVYGRHVSFIDKLREIADAVGCDLVVEFKERRRSV